MGATTSRINAPPVRVYEQLTKSVDGLQPGPLKVGEQFSVPGQDHAYTVTIVEPPNRFGYTIQSPDGKNSLVTEYTILPDGSGSLVSVEMESRSTQAPLLGMLFGAVQEGKTERDALETLKAAVESA